MNFFFHQLKCLQIFLMTMLYTAQYMHAGYIGNQISSTISILNTQTNTISDIVSDPQSRINDPVYIVFTPDGKTAYVANGGNTITYINVSTNTVQGSVAGGPFTNLYSLAITPDGSKLYALSGGNNTIYVIDPATNTFLHNVSGVLSGPFFMAITPDGTTGYVTNFNNNTVSIVDIATDTVTGTITHPAMSGPFALAITPDGSTVYACNFTGGHIVIVDVATNTATGTITSSLLSEIDFIAITPNGKTAYTCNGSSNNVGVINLATQAVSLINDPSFSASDYLAISNDGKTVYVVNLNDNSVTIISTATNTVTGTAQDPQSTLKRPFPIALFPAPYPPRLVSGCRAYNRFLTQVDIMNVLTWTASFSGSAVTQYLVYRDAGLLNVAGSVPATGTLQFIDHNQQNIPTTYYIVAVNALGYISQPVSVSITQNCNS